MGLQTLDRAMAALHALGAGGPAGLRFVDLQKSLGLTKPTAHRLLVPALGQSRAARAGVLAISARPRPAVANAVGHASGPGPAPHLHAGGAAAGRGIEATRSFLSARDGLFTVCLSRATGDYPIRAITVDVGSRRPLGIGAGGLAILGALPVPESERIVDVLGPKFAPFPLSSAEQILRSARLARKLGYALSDERVALGVRAVGVALHDAAPANRSPRSAPARSASGFPQNAFRCSSACSSASGSASRRRSWRQAALRSPSSMPLRARTWPCCIARKSLSLASPASPAGPSCLRSFSQPRRPPSRRSGRASRCTSSRRSRPPVRAMRRAPRRIEAGRRAGPPFRHREQARRLRAIGLLYVVEAPPDGYTLLMSATSSHISPYLLKNQSFDPLKDLLPIVRVGSSPFYLLIISQVPAKNLAELIGLAKSRPGHFTYGTPGLEHAGAPVRRDVQGASRRRSPARAVQGLGSRSSPT